MLSSVVTEEEEEEEEEEDESPQNKPHTLNMNMTFPPPWLWSAEGLTKPEPRCLQGVKLVMWCYEVCPTACISLSHKPCLLHVSGWDMGHILKSQSIVCPLVADLTRLTSGNDYKEEFRLVSLYFPPNFKSP